MHGPPRHCMRPNFFVNTPDINPYYLQTGGRAAHRVRLILAATLGGNYGVNNGFELCEATALPGKEEYADSEKYEIKAWDWDRAGHIRDDIRFINGLRRSSPALQQFDNTVFYNAWNDNILYYGKATADKWRVPAVRRQSRSAQRARRRFRSAAVGVGTSRSCVNRGRGRRRQATGLLGPERCSTCGSIRMSGLT